jgi:protein N-terminal glutamine amidohydrolase
MVASCTLDVAGCRCQDGDVDHPLDAAGEPPYQPFYCEENIWLLAQDPRCGTGERLVVLITGTNAHVAMWHQKPADTPGEPLLWDYHVVLLARNPGWEVWDFECDLGMPMAANAWMAACFPHQDRLPTRHRPRFRVMPAAEYVATLRSDRSHMRDGNGSFVKAPPPWKPPGSGLDSNLVRFVDLRQTFVGEIVDLAGLHRRLAT